MKQVAAIFVVSAVALAAIGTYLVSKGGGGVETEGNAPNFTLTDTDNDTFSLHDFRGNVVLLNMMATWCPACVQEISYLTDAQQHYGGNVIILSISVGGDSNEMLKNFKTEKGATWRFAVDTDNVLVKYEVDKIPKLVLIDKNENVRFTHVGVTPSSDLITEIDGLL